LYFVHDGGDEAVLGAEVVDEETGAGADLSAKGRRDSPARPCFRK
jgi:hypothetical protein